MTELMTSSVEVLDKADLKIFIQTYRRQYLANKEWLTSEEAAEYFDIKPNTLDHWCSMGKISFYQPTNKRWFHREDIKAFLSRNRKEAFNV